METATQDSRYQGWANWETWNVALWISNEESVYRQMRSLRPFNAIKARQFVQRVYPTGTPDMRGERARFPYSDFVDWQAIADDFNAE